jgi:hypothetical protein
LDPRVRSIRLDFRNADDAAAAARLAADTTLLINNAETQSLGSPSTVPVNAVRDDMETNFFGTLNVIHAFAPAPALSAYNASKLRRDGSSGLLGVADRSQGGRAPVRGHVSPVHRARSKASSQRLLKRSVKRRPSRHVARGVAVTACRVAR